MTWKTLASIVAVASLTASAPAIAADCAALAGKELKACEKENEKETKAAASDAKQDARSVPYTPSDLDPMFANWNAPEKNPFATDAYRVRVTPTELASVDAYLAKAFRIQATVVFARYVVDEATKGNMEVITLIPKMLPMMQQVATDGKALVAEGQALVTTGVPNEIKADPKLAMKAPKILGGLKDGVSALTGAVEAAPEVGKSLAAVPQAAGVGGK